MKILLTLLGLLAILGILYGLAFVGILPTKKWAAKSPALGRVLRAAHLAPPPKKVAAKPAPAAPAPAAPAPAAPIPPAPDPAPAAPDTTLAVSPAQTADTAPQPSPDDKIIAIYATMSPDDIARIFTKLPDPTVVHDLTQLDEKQSGKILAALPPDRAARLSLLMSRPHPNRAPAAPQIPQTAL